MADHHHTGPITSAPMDYPEHERTYEGFLWLVKYGSIAVVAILLGMMVSLVGSWGVIGGLFMFVLSGAVLSYILR